MVLAQPTPKSVLVIDDDNGIRDYVMQVLQDEGYRVAGAANGVEALDYLKGQSHSPCVILLDLTMPLMNGWDFRAAQRKEPDLDAVPVVVLTADGSARQKAAALGAVDYIQKPVSINTLIRTVERICG
jgi:CheY-like chemotaxis protein